MKEINKMRASWTETKKKLKEKFAVLTDGDMLFVEGRQEEMLSRLQAKLGKPRDEIKKILGEL